MPATTSIAIGAMIASAVATVGSGIQAKKNADAQADQYNQSATREREIGRLNARRTEKANEALMAKQRNLLAGTGADLSGGSALLAQSDFAEAAEFEKRLAEAGGETNAIAMENRARIAKAEGQAKFQSSMFRAGSTVLSQGSTTFG